jgi:hypothetical protein
MITDVVLQFMGEKLNLMMIELAQIESQNMISGSIQDYSEVELIEITLREIDLGNIKSIHMSKKEAKKCLDILQTMRTDDENNNQVLEFLRISNN